MPSDRPTPILPISDEDRAVPRAMDYPAVLPALTYSIRDMWAGRMSATVCKQREILQHLVRRTHQASEGGK